MCYMLAQPSCKDLIISVLFTQQKLVSPRVLNEMICPLTELLSSSAECIQFSLVCFLHMQKQRVAPLEDAVAEQLVAPLLRALNTPARHCAGAAALLARAQALSSTVLSLAMHSSVPLGSLFAAVLQKVRYRYVIVTSPFTFSVTFRRTSH